MQNSEQTPPEDMSLQTQQSTPSPSQEDKAQGFLRTLRSKLEEAKKEKFVFLLIGRTGVGKSSTVNSLMGKEIAPVGNWEPTTMSVESYDSQAYDITFTVIDTPGLCDELEEEKNDERYLTLVKSRVSNFDCMWFVSPLTDTRVTSDEKRGIKLITESLGKNCWEHAVIVFTFSNSLSKNVSYQEALSKRTELIRREIAKWAGDGIALNVPSVAVDNTSTTTPDGQEWLGELYTTVFTRMSDQGLISFLVATAPRLNPVVSNASSYSNYDYTPTPSTINSNSINLSERQVTEIKKRIDASIIPTSTIIGAAIGSAFGPVGTAVGGGIGAAVGFLAWIVKR